MQIYDKRIRAKMIPTYPPGEERMAEISNVKVLDEFAVAK